MPNGKVDFHRQLMVKLYVNGVVNLISLAVRMLEYIIYTSYMK